MRLRTQWAATGELATTAKLKIAVIGDSGDGAAFAKVIRLIQQEEAVNEPAKIKIPLSRGDVVKIKEGTFENFEGSVDAIDETSGKISVLIEIFGRSTPVELEYWQVEKP